MRRAAAVVGLLSLLAACDTGEEGPPPLDPETVAFGKQVYQQYCAACHGARGEGQPNWEQSNELGELSAPPHDSTGHTWKHSDAMLYYIILQGWRDPFNETERLTMPAFGDVLSPKQIRAVMTYLKALWTPEQQRFQWEESRDKPFPMEDTA
ncbi:MAG: c-type cytochrome [Longimicrobiaceae bacterium]